MVEMEKYIYGSANSLDVDIVYIVDKLPETIEECKKFCLSKKYDNENVNIATMKDGVINSVFKGTPDELNNAVFTTYNLHKQTSPLKIERMVERDVYLKSIRAVRSILSHFSRSCFREYVKSALRSDWNTRLYTLSILSDTDKEIDFNTLNNNMSDVDVMKLIAFQIGQTTALLDGVELFTKDDVGERYPELAPFLKRESTNWKILQKELSKFTSRMYDITRDELISGKPIVSFNGVLYDLQTEKRCQ